MSPSDPAAASRQDSSLHGSTIIHLPHLIADPGSYGFLPFKPHVQKLILAGTAASQHICILWYTSPDGGVDFHTHAMTEAVYVIQGSQADHRGTYGAGSLYFNPPGSGHRIVNSHGFFLLAYASPPDFANTAFDADYVPVHINTAAAITEAYPFIEQAKGIATYPIPLAPQGGMQAELIRLRAGQTYRYSGNYLLGLRGRCLINGQPSQDTLVVAATAPQTYCLKADAETCWLLGLAF